MPSAAQYAAFLATGICPRCQKRDIWRGTKLCLVCPRKRDASRKAWAQRNRDKVRGYRRMSHQKLKHRRDRCLRCFKPIKKFRRCFLCRRLHAAEARKRRRRKKLQVPLDVPVKGRI